MTKRVPAEIVEPERKRGPGRPRFEPTDRERAQIARLSRLGLTQEQMAAVLDINTTTLRIHFKRELECASIEATATVAETLYQIATNPEHPKAVTAAIFWMKARAGWRDHTRLELTGADGAPIKMETSNNVIDARSIPVEHRGALREIIGAYMRQQAEAGDAEDAEDDVDGGDDVVEAGLAAAREATGEAPRDEWE